MEKATSFAFVFTIIYVLFVGLVMFNIVIAILSESFDSVKHRTRTLGPPTEIYTPYRLSSIAHMPYPFKRSPLRTSGLLGAAQKALIRARCMRSSVVLLALPSHPRGSFGAVAGVLFVWGR